MILFNYSLGPVDQAVRLTFTHSVTMYMGKCGYIYKFSCLKEKQDFQNKKVLPGNPLSGTILDGSGPVMAATSGPQIEGTGK